MEEHTHSEGWITFAAIIAGLAGVANALYGLAAVMNTAALAEVSVLFANIMTWGWVMLVFGGLQILAAFLLMGRSNAGRIFAIVLASVSLIAWVTWVGVFPFAALTALTLDILVIYGLSVTAEYFKTSEAREAKPAAPAPGGGVPAH